MNRKEHIDWAKQRAYEYIDAGNLSEGFASFVSDMRKHDETAKHPGVLVMFELRLNGHLDTQESLRKFISEFQ